MKNIKKKFYHLSPKNRKKILIKKQIYNKKYDIQLSEKNYNQIIENAITTFELPLGVVPDFKINKKKYCIPMAIEEPSVIAGLNNANKIINKYGYIKTKVIKRYMTGQIIYLNIKNKNILIKYIKIIKKNINNFIKKKYPSFLKYNRKIKKISYNEIKIKKNKFFIINLKINTSNALGANTINTITEIISNYFKKKIKKKPLISMFSNFSKHCLTKAECFLSFNKEKKWIKICKKIELANKFAENNIDRAATHNKGIMNGVEAVSIATGNDWRAISSSIHSFAAKKKKYFPLTKWKYNVKKNKLYGKIILPLPVATIGGSINYLPKAKLSQKILNIKNAKQLMNIIAGVAIAQNFSALYAIVTDGIQKGHMKLATRSLLIKTKNKDKKLDKIIKYFKKKKKPLILSEIKKLLYKKK